MLVVFGGEISQCLANNQQFWRKEEEWHPVRNAKRAGFRLKLEVFNFPKCITIDAYV
jgi:hypothetical protein